MKAVLKPLFLSNQTTMLRRFYFWVGVLFLTGAALRGQPLTVLQNFTNFENPEGELVAAASGTLFGVTLQGGNGDGGGAVYSIKADGSGYTILQSFNYNGDTNGFGPAAGLVLSGDMLYGTCSEGGSSNYGTIFGLQTNGGGFFILHEFAGGADEGSPQGGLILIGDTLFGTTQYGTVFAVNTDGSGFTNLHVFTGPDGSDPFGTLAVSGSTIFGTTSSGGQFGLGTVFSLQSDGTGFTNLHHFTGATDGSSPNRRLAILGDTLYGTATYSGVYSNGVVFSVKTDGSAFATLHAFANSATDGSHPYCDLAISGSTIYGTTISGGANSEGTLFSMNIDGSFYADLADFGPTVGENPLSGVVLANNVLYGVTTESGPGGSGSIYSFPLPLFQALEITSQPIGATNVAIGSSVSFSVVAESSVTPALVYQWRLNGVDIPGATNATLDIEPVEATNAGVYTVVVSDGDTTLTSSNAPLTLNVTFATSNDSTNTPTVLTSTDSGLIASENTNATAAPGETPVLPGNPPAKSIWFKWTAPGSGVATFTTQGSGFDTVLGAFEIDGQSLTRVGQADDDGGGFLTSLITFNATEGSNYLIGVDGHGGASGNVLLSWNNVEGPAGPVVITPPVAKTVVSNTADANFTCDANGGFAAWFKVGDPFQVGGGTDFSIDSVTAATVGTYFAVVQGSSSVETEPFLVQINLLEDGTTDTNSLAYNKLFDAASHPFLQPPPQGQHVRTGGGDTRGYSVSQIFSTVGNVSEPGEPAICGQIGGAPAWYAYVAPTNGAMSVNTSGSRFNTMLAVYNGSAASFATLNNLGCGYAANAGQSQPQVFVSGATKGETFYVQVDGYHGASGVVDLNINFGQPVTTARPTDQFVALGSAAVLSVAASGSAPISYQWQVHGTNIPGATNATLLFPSVSVSDLGSYTVTVTNIVSQTNCLLTLGLATAPVITAQPSAGTIHPGATATLNVTATGGPPPAYYWTFNGAPAGGNSNTLVVANFATANEGTYAVLASNALGTAKSSNALLYLDTLRLLAPTLAAGTFQMQFTGSAGSNYVVQTSVDLSNWATLSAFGTTNGIMEISDTNAGTSPFRFYRAVTN
jgi:uncharacterized repeat protein (TIGR03803 family)